MSNYNLTKAAEADLESIARYTYLEWGDRQAGAYLGKLKNCFQNIGQGKVLRKTYSQRHSNVFVTHCEYHYVFYLFPKKRESRFLCCFA